MIHAGWRNGPIEDVHADPASPLTDGVMLRLNTFLCSVALEVTADWADEVTDLHTLTAPELNELLIDHHEALMAVDLQLPIGGTIADAAGDEADEVEGRLLDVLGATYGMAEELGVATAVLARASMAPRDWWGGPQWPAKAERFIALLDLPDDVHWNRIEHVLTGEVPAEIRDRDGLRDALLNHPWTLSTEACTWLVRALIEYVRPGIDSGAGQTGRMP